MNRQNAIKHNLAAGFTALILASFFLTGCTPPVLLGGAAATANYILQQDVANLKERNYGAADYMITQASNFIKKTDLIRAAALHDALEPRLTSAVGEIIPHQVGTRLSQLGYRVDLRAVTRQGETFYLAPNLDSDEKARYILSGTYSKTNGGMLSLRDKLSVNLRITDQITGRTLSAFDYTIELKGDVNEFSDSKPRIIRITEDQN